MALAKRGSRRIVVDGVSYRWRLRKRPTPDQRTGRTPLIVAVAADIGEGPALIVRLHRLHPANQIGHRSRAVTPAQVAAAIRQGLAEGWQPLVPGKPFTLLPRGGDPGQASLTTYPGGRNPPTKLQLQEIAEQRERYDTLKLGSVAPVQWPEGGTFHPCGLLINGRDLIDWVREAETPHVEHELKLRREAGEDIAHTRNFAGEYLCLQLSRFRLPSRYLLDRGVCGPVDHFAVANDDPRRAKTMLLSCTCGITECWFLLASITVLDDFVVWSDFEQFHRNWVYDLGPFVFEKPAYLAALGSG